MKIGFNNDIPVIYDFLQVVIYGYNQPDFMMKGGGGMEPSKEVADSLARIWEGFDHDVPGLSLFFTADENKSSYASHTFCRMMLECKNLDEFIQRIFEPDSQETLASLLAYYDNDTAGNRNMDFYRGMLTKKDTLFPFVHKLGISPQQKLEIMGLFSNPEEVMEPLQLFLHRIKRRIKREYSTHVEKIRGFNKKLSVKVRTDGENFLNTELKPFMEKVHPEKYEELIFTYSFINEYSLFTLSGKNKKSIYVFLGMEYEKTLSSVSVKDILSENELFFKALSDKNRLNMISLLSQRKMYVGEIARACNLVISTASYHLDLLLNAFIVNGTVINKKMYYALNEDYLINKFEQLKQSSMRKRF
ncbi:MAG: winged helix-turn-helix domain-containing protein [Clostridia bacterium]